VQPLQELIKGFQVPEDGIDVPVIADVIAVVILR
jgi:hypothetical protein